MMQVRAILQRADPALKLLIVLGTGLYLTKLSLRTADYLHRDPLFVLGEGIIAVCFTFEYLMRWLDDAQDHYAREPYFNLIISREG